MTTTVLPRVGTCRIGLLGLGTVGSAVSRLTDECAAAFAARGFTPRISTALVRSARGDRSGAERITSSPHEFFDTPVDVVVEALGGVDPAFTLVRAALERGIPVVTANKSLIAAHGETLARIAVRGRTALRYEAACIAGVPFLGAFERRPLAARASEVTGILNGTSNYILTSLASGGTFDSALADAQRLGLAEPDPAMDVSGGDASEKLAILARVFGRLLLPPAAIPREAISGVDAGDIAAAASFGGALRPAAYASWSGTEVFAHVGPTFLDGAHPLAGVAGITNGVLIAAERGALCYTGPGGGPEVTAATILDDVAEIVREGAERLGAIEEAREVTQVSRPPSAWFVRVERRLQQSDLADLLASFGTWCTRIDSHAQRTYLLTCPAGHSRIQAALAAIGGATGARAVAFPALADGRS